MSAFRKLLLLAAAAAVAAVQGCGWLALTGATGATYVAVSDKSTQAMTDISNSGGASQVEDAMRVWMERGQLPIPVMDDGVHSFRLRTVGYATVESARGARVVQLCDGDKVVAEYTVAWDKVPVEYRVVSAKNMQYEGSLNVSDVPVLRTYEMQ